MSGVLGSDPYAAPRDLHHDVREALGGVGDADRLRSRRGVRELLGRGERAPQDRGQALGGEFGLRHDDRAA